MENFSVSNTIWILICTIIIFMMQPGFAMLEAGMTRSKNSGNIMMKNLLDFVIGSIAFWMIGYGFLQGAGNGIIGQFDLFSNGNYEIQGFSKYSYLMYQLMFCATAATIVSGAMAERTKFSVYLIYSFCMSAFIYPIEAHWIWGGGWLSNLKIGTAIGFLDCAGGTAVHTVGGIAAFIGALLLGPRIGKYDKNKKSIAIPGHSIVLATLGIFLLWFAWFGFNTSTVRDISLDKHIETVSNIFIVTNLTAASGALTTLFLTWRRYHKPDIAMTLNGVLGGLVASTAGCNVISPGMGCIVGIIAGFLVVYGIEFVDQKLHVDDPIGASIAHGLCGIWGSIAIGLFHYEKGLFVSGDASQLMIQCIGVGSVVIFVICTMGSIFYILKKTMGLRVTHEEEIIGLDIGEHALESYYEDITEHHQEKLDNNYNMNNLQTYDDEQIPANKNINSQMPFMKPEETPNYDKINSVVIICKESKLNSLKNALNEIGVLGITVSRVLGCGVQNGKSEYYRGADMKVNLLTKLRVEVVVSKIPVDLVVNTARKVLFTGHIGDGKIFVYSVENVIKVRTGEQGMKALQDPESYQETDDE